MINYSTKRLILNNFAAARHRRENTRLWFGFIQTPEINWQRVQTRRSPLSTAPGRSNKQHRFRISSANASHPQVRSTNPSGYNATKKQLF